MIDYESLNKSTLKTIFGSNDCVAILFHIVHDGVVTPIGHWCLLIKAKGKNPIQFFDSLGLGLKKILHKTNEKPWLWNLQTQGRDFKECGSFVATRGFFYGLSNSEYVSMLGGLLGPDRNVVFLTLMHYIDFYHVDKKEHVNSS